MRALSFGALVPVLMLAGCAGVPGSAMHVNDADGMRKSLTGHDAQALAPQAFAKAELELKLAHEADASGDSTGAELHADRAVAGFADAVALARGIRAEGEENAASKLLARASEQAQKWATDRRAADHEADDLAKQLRIAREAQLPAKSAAADPEREGARRVAANTLVMQARLLCSAAALVSTQAPGLTEADAAVTAIEKGNATIDAAARARTGCLSVLNRARRANGANDDKVDALLTELSAAHPAGKGGIEIAPVRDERGVVVTVRGGAAPDNDAAFRDLGRVAAAHPTFAVQIVMHDADSASGANDSKRAEVVQKALVAGGADATKTKIELAGTKSPVVDPRDGKRRERNARIEVVFVSRGD